MWATWLGRRFPSMFSFFSAFASPLEPCYVDFTSPLTLTRLRHAHPAFPCAWPFAQSANCGSRATCGSLGTYRWLWRKIENENKTTTISFITFLKDIIHITVWIILFYRSCKTSTDRIGSSVSKVCRPLAQAILSLVSLPNLHLFIFLVSAPAPLSQENLPIDQIALLSMVFLEFVLFAVFYLVKTWLISVSTTRLWVPRGPVILIVLFTTVSPEPSKVPGM